ncbi:hypothetical protein ASG82_24325 [Mycobacterium sp. Soil538]|nr:hypothetical protein ASG82_24325 [Mycobacterium sp. Soil538]
MLALSAMVFLLELPNSRRVDGEITPWSIAETSGSVTVVTAIAGRCAAHGPPPRGGRSATMVGMIRLERGKVSL